MKQNVGGIEKVVFVKREDDVLIRLPDGWEGRGALCEAVSVPVRRVYAWVDVNGGLHLDSDDPGYFVPHYDYEEFRTEVFSAPPVELDDGIYAQVPGDVIEGCCCEDLASATLNVAGDIAEITIY